MQAIDLIDEAGSRVRLRHAQLPEEARDLDKELRALLKEKDAAVRGQVGRLLLPACRVVVGAQSGVLEGGGAVLLVRGVACWKAEGLCWRLHVLLRVAGTQRGRLFCRLVAQPLMCLCCAWTAATIMCCMWQPFPCSWCHGWCCMLDLCMARVC